MNTAEKPAAGLLKLTPELKAFIAEWKSKPGNLIMVLHRVQQNFGYIPREVAFEVADLLDIPLAKIYGVITFYNFFKLKKPGRNQIQVCMGTACYLKGGEDIIQELEGILGVGLNTVTPDGEFSVEAVRCVGCCGLAPVMVLNGEVFGKVKTEDLRGIIAKTKRG
ncbi:MAG: NAD(P)H-dependent oxidoreductase subunit E [Kiritimatiellae bacterium]|nr:NAD(P)H-dependent oxidoreductase subunit E [Kiritimatiellia bacterium]